jgi:group I intron endonuclease
MSHNIYTIYKATNNVNGKVYIGFDSKWPKRQKAHKTCKDNTVFYNAIRKYGWEAFSWEIIYQSKDKDHTLKEMEPHFIKEFDTFYTNDKGYNMTSGGDGIIGLVITEEHRKKLSIANKGNKHTEETKRKIAEAGKGRTQSEEGKKRISDAQKGKKHTKEQIEKWKKSRSEYKHTPETLEKMSKSMKGKNKGKNNGMYGKIPWNKGLKKSI